MDHHTLIIGIACCLIPFGGMVAGCAPYQRIPPDTGVSFAAHLVKGGLMIDRMRNDDRTALATSTRWLRLHHEPTLVLQKGTSHGEGIWLDGPGNAVVRTSESPDAPIVGRVEPAWTDQAIRLTIEPIGAPSVSTGVFVRATGGLGPDELTRRVRRSDEIHGAYRAPLHTADGRTVGWLQVKVGAEQPSPIMYEAVLPPGIDEGLAVASAAALGRELDWIDRHTLDAMPGMVDRP